MIDVFYYVLFGLTALACSPIMTAFVNKFVKEELENKKEFVLKFDWKISVVTVITVLLLFFFHGVTLEFFIYSFVSILLIICAFADIRAQIIPNEINMLGFIVGLCYAYYRMTKDVSLGLDSLGGMLLGGLIFLAIAGFSMLVYKKEGMGGGDIKLMGVLGLFLGVKNIVQVFILSFFVGAIACIILLATKIKKSDDYIAFGPYIVISAIITMIIPATTSLSYMLKFLGRI